MSMWRAAASRLLRRRSPLPPTSDSSYALLLHARPFSPPPPRPAPAQAEVTPAEARRLLRLVGVEALKRRLRDGRDEVVGYGELLDACVEAGAARTHADAEALARAMDDAGVVLLFRDKAYLHPEKAPVLLNRCLFLTYPGQNKEQRPNNALWRKSGILLLSSTTLKASKHPPEIKVLLYSLSVDTTSMKAKILSNKDCITSVVDLVRRAVPLALGPENDPRKEEFKQLQEKKEEIDKLAHKQVRRILWSGLGFFMCQVGLFFRLTFWEFSWDVMEPIAFFTTASGLLVGYAYFLITSRDPTYQDFMERLFLSRQRKLCAAQKFDMERYLELQKQCRCPLEGHHSHGPKLHGL
ncbi:hypothetical protein C2845_PM06G15340 [Panicum miliaceum]|uniref:Calcium uniporter protein C-terminal domain-containing protein n=1 Tax=Panicum miliaceum TaxID=4540 RepID=A0A3L6R7Z4_PANMI|nr:hypothetical protein C2845_PM06G15340 [Panicum miliaceum]